MDFSIGLVNGLQQNGLPDKAPFFESMPGSSANFMDRNILQQQHVQQPIGSGENTSQSIFVSLPALSLEAHPSVVDRHHLTCTHSSSGWHDSPTSNAADSQSSPTNSLISSPNSSNIPSTPPIDPLILNPVKGSKILQPEDTIKAPKRRRGRPRLSEGAPRKIRAAAMAAAAATKLPRKKTSQRTSTALASGAYEHPKKHGDTTDDRKHHIRARNREAAYKCRQKQHKSVEELQTQEAIAASINKNLNNEAAQLRGEILMLKNMILQHGGCGCSYIEEYISGAAHVLARLAMAAAIPLSVGIMPMAGQNCTSELSGEEYVDWTQFKMDTEAGMPFLESERDFSGFDDVASHSVRAESQDATME